MIILIYSHAIHTLVDPKALTDSDPETPRRITATYLIVVVLIVLMVTLYVLLNIFFHLIVIIRVFIGFKVGLFLVLVARIVITSHIIPWRFLLVMIFQLLLRFCDFWIFFCWGEIFVLIEVKTLIVVLGWGWFLST